jgi:hypothetical protein
MAYADYEFYSDVYMGDSLTAEDAVVWLKRASDDVNRATRSKIGINPDDGLTEFQIERIKYATCLTADFLKSVGDSVQSGTVTGYSIGDVNVQMSTADKSYVETYGIPKKAYDELIQTGLLYLGVR